ncbi:hypothetical protein AeRB84_021094, partial [Aphanomyces euteiches]
MRMRIRKPFRILRRKAQANKPVKKSNVLMKKAGPNAAGKRTRSALNEVKERTPSAPAASSAVQQEDSDEESSDDSDSDYSVEGDEVRVQTQRYDWLTSAGVDEETQNQKRSRSPSPDYGIFTDETTDVQRKLFYQLAAAVPQYTKKNIDLTHDKYLKIHNAALLCEAAQQLYNVTVRRVCGVDRQAYDSIEEYLEADNPFDFEDEELRRAKKKVRRMEEQMMGMEKRKKPSKTERRRMHAEAIADRKRRNAEIEEQQKEEKRKAQRVEDNWTKGMSPSKQNLPPGSICVTDPQYGKDRRDVIVLHDATFQDVQDHHDAADPQGATRYGTDCRDVIDLNRAADLLHVDDLAANHADDLHQMDDLAWNQDDDLQHGHDLHEAPIIKKYERQHLIEWRKKRIKYESEVQGMAVEYGLAWRSYIRKWIDSIEPSLLTALCEYQWYCKREDLTEGQFQRYILDVIETRPSKRKVTATNLKKALKDVTMEAKGEVNHRLVSFMEKVHDAITNHCLWQPLEEKDTRKVFIRAVIDKIRPPELADQVSENYEVAQGKSTLRELSELIREQMVWMQDCDELKEKHEYGRSKHTREDNEPSGKRHQLDSTSKHRRSEERAAPRSRQDDLRASTRHNQMISKYGPSSEKSDKPKVKFESKTATELVCFKCRKPGHRIADCPEKVISGVQVSKKLSNAVSRHRYHERKKAKAKRAKSETNQERYVNINSALNCLYCPDTGAEIDIIPMSILEELKAKCPTLEMVQLREPLKGLGCNDQGFESHAYVELDLTMQTSAGAVRVPGKRKCYIVAEGDELLISDQTLRLVGINIDRILAETAQRMACEEDDLEETES